MLTEMQISVKVNSGLKQNFKAACNKWAKHMYMKRALENFIRWYIEKPSSINLIESDRNECFTFKIDSQIARNFIQITDEYNRNAVIEAFMLSFIEQSANHTTIKQNTGEYILQESIALSFRK